MDWQKISKVIYECEGRETGNDGGYTLRMAQGERRKEVASKLIIGLVRHKYLVGRKEATT